MIKWFAYIVLLLIFATRISFANALTKNIDALAHAGNKKPGALSYTLLAADTTTKTKKQLEDEKKKIKEIAKAKRQAKPATVDEDAVPPKPKPKRQRRPEGMERPPEIPRRNGS
ncbi:hypothetical protein DIU31_029335 [Mucilaginibacter rubeus]|uniref:Uncharacterized protein n=2 Tax=Mucilaginibacter TaxID=423349 RepID=A0AAE6JK60_9SPHI|nr:MULTISPECIES: hypothetical protein [Mucilaginibacter]QEM07407.1 hypothetical protein DIU31_029335 [Mucilaginibacter rubeus]QEM19861.1 hypothetical protein DIU38_028920 [Mucilaginibacter gossypii]QTE35127.1 hypothetical protein J3L18_18480 [Mucilaginibacter gossypii]QTE43436.1 hypothetical protein J3L19_31715 [Mucilaginibacter rubeus]QTE50036.1 hypothetical protein J3L21_31670 [Mucilaginibacter rubeus]